MQQAKRTSGSRHAPPRRPLVDNVPGCALRHTEFARYFGSGNALHGIPSLTNGCSTSRSSCMSSTSIKSNSWSTDSSQTTVSILDSTWLVAGESVGIDCCGASRAGAVSEMGLDGESGRSDREYPWQNEHDQAGHRDCCTGGDKCLPMIASEGSIVSST